jgi:hypothetical protein
VLIRQVQATDAPLLAGIFAQLSATSRWMRFLASKNHLTEAELRYLTDIDHHDHEALAALDGCSGRGLGRRPLHPSRCRSPAPPSSPSLSSTPGTAGAWAPAC